MINFNCFIGTIDFKEFILTMLAFRQVSEPPNKSNNMNNNNNQDNDVDEEIIKLYFNLFDINQSGHIDQDELQICLENLLPEGHYPNLNQNGTLQTDINPITFVQNILEMFQVIDTSKDGYIDYEEFKKFYTTIMRQSSNKISLEIDNTNENFYASKLEIKSYEIDTPTYKENKVKSMQFTRSNTPPPEKNRTNSSPFRPHSPNPLSITNRSHSPPPSERKKDSLHSQLDSNSSNKSTPSKSNNNTNNNQHQNENENGNGNENEGRNKTNSNNPTPISSPPRTPPPPILNSNVESTIISPEPLPLHLPPANTSPKTKKGVSKALNSRIQGLDPTKIIMPGMPMPKKLSNAPMMIQKQNSDSSESSDVNIQPHLRRGTLKTGKPRRRMMARRKSSAGLIIENLEALEKPIENSSTT